MIVTKSEKIAYRDKNGVIKSAVKCYPVNSNGQVIYNKKGITLLDRSPYELERSVRNFRLNRKHYRDETIVKRFKGMRYTKVNGIIGPREIKRLLDEKRSEKYQSKLTVLNRSKKPTAKDMQNNVGIEIEFVSVLDSSRLMLELVKADVQRWCTLKDDGSLRAGSDSANCSACTGRDCECDRDNDGCGCDCTCDGSEASTPKHTHCHELVMIGSESNFKERLQKILVVLNGIGEAIVNRTCGLHVHLDMRHRDRYESYSRLLRAQRLLYSMISSNRYNNDFCKPIYEMTQTFERGLTQGGRYWGINAASYSRHKTIEIRLHSGTTNYEKISNFVELLIGVVNSPIPAILPLTVEEFKKAYGISEAVAQYVIKRILEFKGNRMYVRYHDAIVRGAFEPKELQYVTYAPIAARDASADMTLDTGTFANGSNVMIDEASRVFRAYVDGTTLTGHTSILTGTPQRRETMEERAIRENDQLDSLRYASMTLENATQAAVNDADQLMRLPIMSEAIAEAIRDRYAQAVSMPLNETMRDAAIYGSGALMITSDDQGNTEIANAPIQETYPADVDYTDYDESIPF